MLGFGKKKGFGGSRFGKSKFGGSGFGGNQNQSNQNQDFNRNSGNYSGNYGNGFQGNGNSGGGFGGGGGNRFGNGGNRFGGGSGGRRMGSGKAALMATLLVLAIIGLGVWTQSTGLLGHEKNKWLNSPTKAGGQNTISARMNAGLAQLQQTNKNLDVQQLDKQGHHQFDNEAVNDPILLKDFFSYIPDMYSFGKVYSIYFFANTNADKQWKAGIEQQRNKNDLKIMTFNGNSAQKDDGTFIYRYFYHNYDVPKTDKRYGKVDGVGHPFMALFVNGVPQNIIVDYKDFNGLVQKQNEIQERVDKSMNNYNLPDQKVGLPYPDYGAAITQGKAYAEKITGHGDSSSSSSQSGSSSSNSSSIDINQQDDKQK